MIEISHLTKSYGDKKALDNVNLSIGPGEIVGLFGENGAGKTTLMHCALGYRRFEGSILLDGAPVTCRNITRMSFATCEHSFFPQLTPQEHRTFYAAHFSTFDDRRFAALMDFFHLPLNKPLRSFSTGQKNQFEVLLALSQGANYMWMDEPFAGSDVFNREDFYKVLLGILQPTETVILATHLMEEVEHFISRAVLLREGRIIDDTSVMELEEQGVGLMDYVKSAYGYRGDRVSRAVADLAGEEEP